MIEKIEKYIAEILGIAVKITAVPPIKLGHLPLYISETFILYETNLLQQELLLVEYRNANDLTVMQLVKHFELLKKSFLKKVVLVEFEITALNRKRLIEKGINFIIPSKQLYLPEMLIDLRENFTNPLTIKNNKTLLPSAQMLLLYYILHKNDSLEKYSFKELAFKFNYTQMAITKAVENLKQFELIKVEGEKEKCIRFLYDRKELWSKTETQNQFSNPVLKKVYVDELPQGISLFYCNTSALPLYSNMSQSRQLFYAIEKNNYYKLQKNNSLLNENNNEGTFCLEVWKYNHEPLVTELNNDSAVVDPFSLYLSLKENRDERIEMALEQILERFFMVKGLDTFKEYFAQYPDNYLIIGGTACDIIIADAGFTPRATKDIDMILVVEALTISFVTQFWEFVKDGKYTHQEKSTSKRQYYRFYAPQNKAFPEMVELFARKPDAVLLNEPAHLTPIPVEADLSSLSAILLSDNYYNYILSHTLVDEQLHLANTEALICLKAKAYLDLTTRKNEGEQIDSRNIQKHKNDIFRLAITLAPAQVFELPQTLKTDLHNFIAEVATNLPDKQIFKEMGVGAIAPEDVMQQIVRSFKLDRQ